MAESKPNRALQTRTLPARPSIEWLKKTAKERLVSLRAENADASLAESQLAVAREYGFISWRALVDHLETLKPAETPIPGDRKARERLLLLAIRAKRLHDAKDVLEADPTLVNAPISDFGQRPISAAARHLPMVDLLLAFGADINQKSDWWAGGWGVLETADDATAEAMIARGAIVDIFAAAHLNKMDRLRELLAGDPSLVHAKGGDGCRPLHFAWSPEVMDILLSYGADIDARDVDHESTAAQWALSRPAEEYPNDSDRAQGLPRVRWLVERGASTDIFMLSALGDLDRLKTLLASDPVAIDAQVGAKNYPPCPDAPGRHIYVYKLNGGRSAFDIASAFGNPAAVELLLKHSSPKQKFLAACGMGDAKTAADVLRDHPRLQETLTHEEQLVLPNAAWSGNAAAVQLMLDLGFDPLIQASDSGTALHCAAWHGRDAIARIILEHPSVQTRLAEIVSAEEAMYHSTPLGWCCHGSTNCRNPTGDYAAVAKRLLDAGAKPGPNLDNASAQVRAMIESRSA